MQNSKERIWKLITIHLSTLFEDVHVQTYRIKGGKMSMKHEKGDL